MLQLKSPPHIIGMLSPLSCQPSVNFCACMTKVAQIPTKKENACAVSEKVGLPVHKLKSLSLEVNQYKEKYACIQGC